MTYYFAQIDSTGEWVTNLQIYSLQQAAKYWNELVTEISMRDQSAPVTDVSERLAFITNCLGLSLSQLLGQNRINPSGSAVPNPGTLLGEILQHSGLDRTQQKRLNKGFEQLLTYYGAVRHFGRSQDDNAHRTVNSIWRRLPISKQSLLTSGM